MSNGHVKVDQRSTHLTIPAGGLRYPRAGEPSGTRVAAKVARFAAASATVPTVLMAAIDACERSTV
jgi:hypothetical protein